jgi:hypothetical protein
MQNARTTTRTGRPAGPAALMAAALAATVACATAPPQRPLTDVRTIAGNWDGTITTPRGTVAGKHVINADGSAVTTAPIDPGRFELVYQVKDGAAQYTSKTTGRTGRCTLHEGEGKRVLRCRADDGASSAEWTPAK